MNTYNPALSTIGKLGYAIQLLENAEGFDWEASKDGEIFIASDPLRLLGLISLKDEYHAGSMERLYDKILASHFGE
ncbi:hypothetical protein QMK33_10400 [Hymenobacter sp. H14-R3]|uniref:hypothetical protein n=1 Tax=Hymenobacter sp. H14-R3 TaxID=3046308 RepID=UPI0024BB73A7|nr:hypothetical protein [Hymenobacter sp. H14-R3]MDJ0365566.1 hypothetical protein [Hymenobacter sp. H14-R3]